MRKKITLISIVLGMFMLGGLGSLLVNYIVFSKLVTNPKWSDSGFVKALSNKVTVIQAPEKIVVKDNESLVDISSQVLSSLVYIEKYSKNDNGVELIEKGGGIIMTSDGIIAFHKSIFNKDKLNSEYFVYFSDGKKEEATKVYEDEYTGIIFLQINSSNLTTMPFVNSSDMFGGKKLINVYRENYIQNFYNLGVLSGFDYDFQTSDLSVSCDYLQGTFRVDFNEKSLAKGLGFPMIDFNGQMVGLLAKKQFSYNSTHYIDTATKENQILSDDYFVIATNDIKEAFNRFLDSKENNYKKNERFKLGMSCSYFQNKDHSLEGDKIYFSKSIDSKLINIKLLRLGLKNNDIITKFGEYDINFKNSLSKVLLNYKSGDVVKIKLIRNEEKIEVEATL